MSSSPAGRRVAPSLRAVIDTILPAFPPLPGATRNDVAADVAVYVGDQIDAMPSFLRLPYRVALFGFTWLAVLRHGRTFTALPAVTRAAYLSAWSNAPLAPMRDFVKLIRSTALLVYFDHPAVLEHLRAAGVAEGGDE